jgi:hypothetical protein
MLVGDKVTHDAVNEAYCLISAYIREEGTVSAKYNKEELLLFVKFLSEILKHPENFVEKKVVETPKSVMEHDGLGLA